ncbi:MAG TPA: hypothetical protein PKE39_12845, partial [Ignavibacteria bacterium]|nr:hypothetical protein [Ignavibacteria bacterium]
DCSEGPKDSFGESLRDKKAQKARDSAETEIVVGQLRNKSGKTNNGGMIPPHPAFGGLSPPYKSRRPGFDTGGELLFVTDSIKSISKIPCIFS